MHRDIVFLYNLLFISVVYYSNKVEGSELPHADLTYTCKSNVISVVTMSNGQYQNIQVINKGTEKGFCRRPNNTAAGLHECIKNNTKAGVVHLLYQQETSPDLVAGDKFAYFELTCNEDVEKKGATVHLTNPFDGSVTASPDWTSLRPMHHSGVLSLDVDKQSNLHVGDPLKLTMTVAETDYILSPQICHAKRKQDDVKKVKIWECKTLADDNIISEPVWTLVGSQNSVLINMLAFKFIDSEDIWIECEAKVCPTPSHSQECILEACKTSRRRRRDLNNSTTGIDIPVKHASVSMKVKDPIFNRSSGLTSRWYSYFVPAFLVIGARLYL